MPVKRRDVIRIAIRGLRILAILSMFAIQARLHPAFGQTQSWAPPLRLTRSSEAGWFADIAADASGQVHVAWSATDNVDTYDLVMYTRLPDGQTWLEANDIVALKHVPGNLYVTRPTFATDRQGQLALGIHGPDDKQYVARAPAAKSQNAFSWDVVQLDGNGYHVVPVYDGNGGLHVIYTQGATAGLCMPCLQVLYSRFEEDNKTWSKPTNISELTNLGAAKPQVLTDRQGHLHVVWEAGSDGDRGYIGDPAAVMYTTSSDNGQSWSVPLRLAPASENDSTTQARNITIGVTGAGDLIVAWWSMPDNHVDYRISSDQGKSWTQPQPIPGVWGVGTSSTTLQDDHAMTTDSSGDVHLVMVGRHTPDQPEVSLLHVVWDGASWSQLETIATYANDLPEWPRVAITLGNSLHVVWHLRPNALVDRSAVQPPQVWYTARTLASPAIAPGTLNMSAAAATGLPEPQPPGSPAAPLPPKENIRPSLVLSETPQSVVSIQSLMTENDDIALLVKSLVPGFLLVGATALVLRYRRRHKAQ